MISLKTHLPIMAINEIMEPVIDWRCRETGALARCDNMSEWQYDGNPGAQFYTAFEEAFGFTLEDYTQVVRAGLCDPNRERVIELAREWDERQNLRLT